MSMAIHVGKNLDIYGHYTISPPCCKVDRIKVYLRQVYISKPMQLMNTLTLLAENGDC
jgi:hypothetical protein